MLNSIQQAVKHHDKYQIEIKLDYELFDAPQTQYDIDTYIFVPQNLGVAPDSYTANAFYRDAQTYIRLKTPALNLRELVESDRSPLLKIEELVATPAWLAAEGEHETLITQFKLLSAIFKSTTRDHFQLIEQRIAEVEATEFGKTHHIIHNLVEEFLTETARVASRFRALFGHFNLPNVPETIFVAYTFTDESLSILIEENSVEMFRVVDEYLKKTNRVEYKQALSERVEAETKYRKSRGYKSILTVGEENDTYLYRASVLKRYASSVLFLNTDVQRDGWQWEQVTYAIAAGISMIFATLLAFYFQAQFGNFTLPFFIALVIGYMFKDRIKDIGRIFLAKRLQEYLHDRRTTISTRDGKHTLGYLREKMRFVDEKSVPASVIRERNRDRITDLSNDGRGEHIICYSKEITLNTKLFGQLYPDFPPVTGINDIFRLDIRAFLTKMAEREQVRHLLQDGEMISLTCHKVYHMHLIARYKSAEPRTGKLRRHLRLILSQAGIERIEEVETSD